MTSENERLRVWKAANVTFRPIELAWSKVKSILRRLKARTLPDWIEALQQALQAITSQDIHGWFAHCGYAIN